MSKLQLDWTTAVVPKLSLPPEMPARSAENRLVLNWISWEGYRKISEAFTGIRVHITYDRGTLEIMTRSSKHETYKAFLGRLVEVLTEETNQPIRNCGEMTCEREDLTRAVEPDECFYLTNEHLVRGRNPIVMGVDPPPDLVVEIEISRSVIARLPIYAALGVPEVWRFDGENIVLLQLTPSGEYAVVERSRYFPFLSAADILRVVQQWGQTDENSLVRSFRQWIRQQLGQKTQ